MKNRWVYWLRYWTGDSTCHLRDDSSSLIYCTKYLECSTLWRDTEGTRFVRKLRETGGMHRPELDGNKQKQVEHTRNYYIVQGPGSVNPYSYPCRHVQTSDLWCRRRCDVRYWGQSSEDQVWGLQGTKRRSYIHEGRLCIKSEILRITARCCAYLLRSGVNYTNSESLESKGVRESRARLCNRSREWLLYCAARELCVWE